MNDFVELRQILTRLLRWWWLLILMTALGAMVGYMASQWQTPVYQATTTIMVGQLIQATQLNKDEIFASEVLAQTYADMARRQPILQAVVDNLNLNSPWTEFRNRVRVEPVAGTQLLQIRVEANSPKIAQLFANEVGRQLILLSPTSIQNQEREENQRFVHQQLERLQARIEAGQARLAALEAVMAEMPIVQQESTTVQSEINTLEKSMTDWENNYTQLLIFMESKNSPNYLTILEPAQANPEPIQPRPKLNMLLAGVVGFLLALGFIFLVEYLDNTLKSADDLSRSLGLTVLGTVSRIEGKQYHDKVITSQDPFCPGSEAYRMIRSNIQFMSVDRPAKIIMVTSPAPGEGKSITAANLGIVMAQAGLKTIIIDADLRLATQHQIFQIPNLGGLTDLLRSPELKPDDYLKKTGVQNLQIITSGVLPPNPSELLGSQRMKQLLASLNEIADMVIFDTPPVVTVTDAAVLSNRVDGVVLVTQFGKTRRDMARQAILHLQQANANIFGGILNRVSKKDGGYYYRQYRTLKWPRSADKLSLARPQRRWQWLPFK